ncbi:GNAT family N-acetyltransferase [Methanobrevibacter sp.]|uniref:GNAT family N-acetyltransferase n=1 Tax=Methanobrevibacter sp. TaxID=66852 RepID=UPI00388E1466
MDNFVIREIRNDEDEIKKVQDFLFEQIKKAYDIGPMPKFHYDILNLKDYYIVPSKNSLFLALDGDVIIASVAIRGYDRDYEFFKGIYTKEKTASIWRLMVDEKYRRRGLARRLVTKAEQFAQNAGYDEIYLNTHRYLDSALPFWDSLGYQTTLEEDDYDETNHLIKSL